MHTLKDGHRQFEELAFPTDRDLYSELAHLHHPTALFIGCSDARVVPEVITSRKPGELFVIRTAGNLVPKHGTVDAVTASIEYAVEVLDVREIVVCGHSACGAMTSLALGHDLSMLPAVAGWLATAGHDPHQNSGCTDEDAVANTVRANVIRQLTNIAAYPGVHQRLLAEQLELTGWIHDISSGRIDVIHPA
ncbi:carbonic anhydrase [Rhodococcoides fascians]|uniref:carbonic anhydrase n=1 Tax=Rhodococcoides fascians TaxID=1828 RepID=UPI00056D6A61|nr:carbonic anhydrase [Rhodococcus fascians]